MKFLALDTCTEACSVALIIGGQVEGEFLHVGNRHSEVLLGMVQRLLSSAQLQIAQLDAIGFTRGPGSFTGVRIGIGVVQGLAFGGDLPVIPVSTLALLAQSAVARHGHPWLLSLLDARMGEVYWAGYQWPGQGSVRAVTEEQVSPAHLIACDPRVSWCAVGPGVTPYRQSLPAWIQGQTPSSPQETLYPDARYAGPLLAEAWQCGQVVAPEDALPLYLRNNVALKPKPAP